MMIHSPYFPEIIKKNISAASVLQGAFLPVAVSRPQGLQRLKMETTAPWVHRVELAFVLLLGREEQW